MTDNTQELDEILDFIENYGVSASCDGFDPHKSRSQAKQALLDWHNKQVKNAVATAEDDLDQYWNKELDKQVEVVLDRLQPKDWASDDTPLSMTRNDFYMTIEAERNKLKERDDE